MKILIAYDGSDCANAAIEDLSRAGLPDAVEAIILTATETWLPKDFENESFVETVGWTGAENIKRMREAAVEKVAEGGFKSDEYLAIFTLYDSRNGGLDDLPCFIRLFAAGEFWKSQGISKSDFIRRCGQFDYSLHLSLHYS